jgi:hypothetical protein
MLLLALPLLNIRFQQEGLWIRSYLLLIVSGIVASMVRLHIPKKRYAGVVNVISRQCFGRPDDLAFVEASARFAEDFQD